MALTSRLATHDDVPILRRVMQAAIDELQKGFLDEAQIRSSHAIMGLDTQLIDDGTYFVVELDGQVAGCGGWSRRATLYGGNHTDGRDAALLDPATDAARVRAMYTHPACARRGVGRLILSLCEAAAEREGFAELELMGTLSGRALYEAGGFRGRRACLGFVGRRRGAARQDAQGHRSRDRLAPACTTVRACSSFSSSTMGRGC